MSGGQPANFFALTDTTVAGTAAVYDSASFKQGTVTPNGILTYSGPVGCSPNEKVLINGESAGILFTNSTQINFVSPESPVVNPAAIQLFCNDVPIVTLTAPLAPVSPSLFTQTGTGTGQGSIVNFDGAINSTASPVARGAYISLYGTGFGSLDPQARDGLRHLAASARPWAEQARR